MMNCSCGTERFTGKLSIHDAHSLTLECTDICLVHSSTGLRNEPHTQDLNEPGAEPDVICWLERGGERLVSGDISLGRNATPLLPLQL